VADISISEINNYLRCRNMQRLAGFSFLGLRPIAPSLKLDVGSAVHAALAAQAFGRDPEQFLKDEWFPARRSEMTVAYRKVVGVDPGMTEFGVLQETQNQALACVKRYFDRYGQEAPLGAWTLLAPEVPCRVPIPNTDGGYLIALLDGLAAKTANPSEVAILETKTYGRRPSRQDLEDQHQYVGYTWVCRILFGVTPRVLYNGIARQPPKTSRISYPEGQDKNFTRWVFDYAHRKLYNFQCELTDIYNEMELFRQGKLKNQHNFRREGCWDCSVADLCKAEYRGEDWEYRAKRMYIRGEPPNRQAQRLAQEGLVTDWEGAKRILESWKATMPSAQAAR
jgi:hypothetical protein